METSSFILRALPAARVSLLLCARVAQHHSKSTMVLTSVMLASSQRSSAFPVVCCLRATGITNRKYLGHNDLVSMEPSEEIPRVFDCWSHWLSAAGICDSLDDVDMLEMHVFGKLHRLTLSR